jgi:hypothetical protein
MQAVSAVAVAQEDLGRVRLYLYQQAPNIQSQLEAAALEQRLAQLKVLLALILCFQQ